MAPGIISVIIFGVSLGLIFSEKVNRTITGIAGAVAMVGAGIAFHFYDEAEAVAAIDFNTLGLLFGMMLLVALLEPSGFFQYVAVWAGRISGGKPVRLFILLGTATTVLSMFLDNVTTVVLIAPVTILIGEILGMSPVPLLMAEALLSNTGGVATLVGDPPNVLIGSAAGLTFIDFITHSLPIVVVIWLVVLLVLRYLFRRELSIQPQDVDAVRTLEPREALHDPVAAKKVLIVLIVAVLFFFLEEVTHLSTSYIAMAGSAVALLWVRPEINETLKRVEWSVLVFFTALFVMVGGLEKAGVLHTLAGLITQSQHISPAWFGVSMIWVVAGLSAVVDNVPITIALIPVILDLGQAGMNITPLWWALAFGAGFGGNGTIIGSTANIVVATLSERTNEPITSAIWNKRGLPVMLVACAVASLLYLLAYPYLSR